MPFWLQVVLTIYTPISGGLIAWLLTKGERKQERRDKQEALSVDALARRHEADLEAEAKFTDSLLRRVGHLEEKDERREQLSELRAEQIRKLEADNIRLTLQVDALKFELAGKINAAVQVIEQKAASALIEAGKKGGE